MEVREVSPACLRSDHDRHRRQEPEKSSSSSNTRLTLASDTSIAGAAGARVTRRGASPRPPSLWRGA
jgi:hypothetical protein